MNRAEVEAFFRTLLLGDFEENQNTAAQLIGGLISMVPVLDQVMDARDITGSVFNISKRGGFKNATPDQIVNLGFAAFGAVPEVGSAFKTVFKPMWKERRAAKGAVNSGLNAIERLLGMSKGGAIGWIRKELLGKWNARTQQAIMAVNAGLASCIELTGFMADAQGWQNWLIPSSVQMLAKEIQPRLKALQSQIDGGLKRASDEIREFLEDLLGEQAAAVAMTVGERAVVASAVPGSRAKAGHNAAAAQPVGKAPARQTSKKVGASERADAKKGAGAVHAVVQVTAKAFRDLGLMEKGLVGEHMADYHELKRLKGSWPHDQKRGTWAPESVKKINADKRPVNLSLEDLPKMREPGIDAVWEHGGRYTVTEAKARESIFVITATVKSLTQKGLVPAPVKELSADLQNLWLLLTKDNKDVVRQGYPLVQMSEQWVASRAKEERLSSNARAALESFDVSRRVVLITLESSGALAHGQALAEIHMGRKVDELCPHEEHGKCRDWGGAEIDMVVDRCRRAHEAKAAKNAGRGETAGPKANKPSKPLKPKK